MINFFLSIVASLSAFPIFTLPPIAREPQINKNIQLTRVFRKRNLHAYIKIGSYNKINL